MPILKREPDCYPPDLLDSAFEEAVGRDERWWLVYTQSRREKDLMRRLGVGDYENYLSIALGAGDTTVLRLTNAYAILANHGRSLTPTLIDFVQDRNGKVIYRADNRCQLMTRCDAPDWDGQAMPRPPSRSKQLLDPMAAFRAVRGRDADPGPLLRRRGLVQVS